MATFAQGIDVQLKLANLDQVLQALDKIEARIKQAFAGGVIEKSQNAATQAVAQSSAKQTEIIKSATQEQTKAVVHSLNIYTKAVDDKAKQAESFVGRISQAFSKMKTYDGAKQVMATKITADVPKLTATPIKQIAYEYTLAGKTIQDAVIAQEHVFIKASEAAKRYNVSLHTMTKWGTRGIVDSRQALKTDLTTPPGEREYNKLQLVNKVIESGMTQADCKANLLNARIDKLAMSFTALVKPVTDFANKMATVANIKVGEGIAKAEEKAKIHEGTLKKVYDFYMKIYTAPFKGVSSAWTFLNKKPAQYTNIEAQPATRALTVATSRALTVPSTTTLAPAASSNAQMPVLSVKEYTAQLKLLGYEAKQTKSIMDHLKSALLFTVKLPLAPFTMAGSAISSLGGIIKSAFTSPIAAVVAGFGLITGAAMMMKNRIATALSFDHEMGMVWTLLNKTQDQMKSVTKDIQQLAREDATSLNETAKGMYWAISAGVNEFAGFSDAQRNAAVKSIGQITAAVGGDTTTTTRAMMGVINSFGNQLGDTFEKQLKKVQDVLFQTTFLGITSIPELAGSLGFLNSIASQSGVSFDEVGAALAVLTRSGMSTDSAVTALKATISEILKPSEQASELAQRLGIDFSIAGLKAKGYAKFMTDMLEKTGGKAEYITVLFNNIRSLTEVMGKIGNNREFLSFAENVQTSSGVTEEALKKLKATMAFKDKQLDVRFEIRSQKFGAMLIPTWQAVKEGYLDIMDSISLLTEEFWLRQSGDTKGADALKAQYEKTVSAMPKALQVVSASIASLVQGLIYLGMELSKYYDPIFKSITTFYNNLKNSMGIDPLLAAMNALGRIGTMAMSKIGAGIMWIIGGFNELSKTVFGFFATIDQGIERVGGKAQAETAMLGSSAQILVTSFGSIFNELWNIIKNVFSILGIILKEIVELEKQFKFVTYAAKGFAIAVIAPLFVITTALDGIVKLVSWWLYLEKQMFGVLGFIMALWKGGAMLVWAILNPSEALNKCWDGINQGLIAAEITLRFFWTWLKECSKEAKNLAGELVAALNPFSKTETKKIIVNELIPDKKVASSSDGMGMTSVKDIAAGIDKVAGALKVVSKGTDPIVNSLNKATQGTKENVDVLVEKQVAEEKIIEILKEKKIAEENVIKTQEKLSAVEKTGNAKELHKAWRQLQDSKESLKVIEKNLATKQLERTNYDAELKKMAEIKSKADTNIIEAQTKTSNKVVDIAKTEAEKIREVQYQKEQNELRYLAKVEYYIEKDAKRKTGFIKKEIEEQQKIFEKASEKRFSIDERYGKAMESFEEKKARIISAPLSQEGKDIQQRGLAELYQNKMGQALGQGNFDEAERLAQKAQDIYASLAERTDNKSKDDDYKNFLKTQDRIVAAYEAEKKANENAMNNATKKIVDLKKELSTIFVDLQKSLSVSVNTDQATMQLSALRTKFNELRKDMAMVMGNDPDEIVEFKNDPAINIPSIKDFKTEKKEDKKIASNTDKTNNILEKILEETKKKETSKDTPKTKSFAQDNKGQFVVAGAN